MTVWCSRMWFLGEECTRPSIPTTQGHPFALTSFQVAVRASDGPLRRQLVPPWISLLVEENQEVSPVREHLAYREWFIEDGIRFLSTGPWIQAEDQRLWMGCVAVDGSAC